MWVIELSPRSNTRSSCGPSVCDSSGRALRRESSDSYYCGSSLVVTYRIMAADIPGHGSGQAVHLTEVSREERDATSVVRKTLESFETRMARVVTYQSDCIEDGPSPARAGYSASCRVSCLALSCPYPIFLAKLRRNTYRRIRSEVVSVRI